LSGLSQNTAWDRKEPKALNFFDLKGYVEAFLDAVHIKHVVFTPVQDATFHPGKCAAVVYEGISVATMGEIHPKTSENYDFLQKKVYLVDFNLDALFNLIPAIFHSQSLSPYPPVLEDLAVIVPDETPAATVAALIQQAGGELLTELRLFDVFKGKQIGDGKKSLAYNLTFQSFERTLTDKNVEKTRNKIIQTLEKQMSAEVRKSK